MSLQGTVIDPANYEPEITLVFRLRMSTNYQLRNQYEELRRQAKPISVRHERVSQDLILGRILKFCLFLSNLKKVSPTSLDKDYFNFKEDFNRDIRNEEKRGELLLTCRIIQNKTSEIMSTPLEQDFLEKKGFNYNEATFCDLFGTGWSNNFDKDDDSGESSNEEEA